MKKDLIIFQERLGGIVAITRSSILGIRIPDPRIVSVKLMLKGGDEFPMDCSYEYAMDRINDFDSTQESK